jgi:hypothetical protein
LTPSSYINRCAIPEGKRRGQAISALFFSVVSATGVS